MILCSARRTDPQLLFGSQFSIEVDRRSKSESFFHAPHNKLQRCPTARSAEVSISLSPSVTSPNNRCFQHLGCCFLQHRSTRTPSTSARRSGGGNVGSSSYHRYRGTAVRVRSVVRHAFFFHKRCIHTALFARRLSYLLRLASPSCTWAKNRNINNR